MKKLISVFAIVLAISLVVTACAAPTPEVVEKEVVVEKPVVQTVIVEKVVEKEVLVEVEKEVVVEKPVVETVIVEKEVVVEKEVLVTVAPPPEVQEITIVMPEEPPHLNWADTGPGSLINALVTLNSYEALVGRAATGELIGVLAESWERVDDATWRFHLRKGVKYHNGEPFNAENVKWNLEIKQDPEKVTMAFAIAGQPLSAEVVDEYTIDLSTPKPEPVLPRWMTEVVMGEPKAVEADPGARNMVGTGAYMLDEWIAGERIVLVANPDYWGGEPPIDKVTFLWRTESAVRAAMLQAGEVGIAAWLTPQEVGPVRTLGAEIPETPFLFYDSNPPLDDIRVRKAICIAVDRDVIAYQIMGGYAEPANELATPDVCGYNPDLPVLPYDPDGARELIEEARADGVLVDTEITLYGRKGIYPNATEVMEAIQLWLTDISLNVKLQMLEVSAWREVNLDIPVPEDRVGIIQSSSGQESGDGFGAIRGYYTYYIPRSEWYSCPGYEDTGYGRRPCIDPKIMEMTEVAKYLSEDEGRCEALGEVYAYHRDNILWACPLVRIQSLWGVSERVDWQPRPDNLLLLKEASLKY